MKTINAVDFLFQCRPPNHHLDKVYSNLCGKMAYGSRGSISHSIKEKWNFFREKKDDKMRKHRRKKKKNCENIGQYTKHNTAHNSYFHICSKCLSTESQLSRSIGQMCHNSMCMWFFVDGKVFISSIYDKEMRERKVFEIFVGKLEFTNKYNRNEGINLPKKMNTKKSLNIHQELRSIAYL